ncbi:hypothetical protein FHU32_002128 [Corynebacterium bovis DSM 20582 = CIP 54.80]|uniref:Peptidyl-tRNA hydrolase n=1 Tax=Corynebacterium bovis DSM 20582 = CIP 54.80 TaxID=927655 RepID=A0A8I0CLP7_9CORY|nr:hypothetical protein [Corynebacterium bovis DSM 20582 = CIP 54.80]
MQFCDFENSIDDLDPADKQAKRISAAVDGSEGRHLSLHPRIRNTELGNRGPICGNRGAAQLLVLRRQRHRLSNNGLRSTTKSLGTKDYMRVRVGIGRPPGRQDPADYVLRNFNAKEREELAFTLPTAAEAVELIASHGLEIAQNQIHGR